MAAHYRAPSIFGSAVYGSALANSCIIAYFDRSDFATKFEVLGYGGYHRTRKNAAMLTDACAFKNSHVGRNPSMVAYDRISINIAKRAYRNAFAELGFGVYVG